MRSVIATYVHLHFHAMYLLSIAGLTKTLEFLKPLIWAVSINNDLIDLHSLACLFF